MSEDQKEPTIIKTDLLKHTIKTYKNESDPKKKYNIRTDAGLYLMGYSQGSAVLEDSVDAVKTLLEFLEIFGKNEKGEWSESGKKVFDMVTVNSIVKDADRAACRNYFRSRKYGSMR